MAGHRKRRAEQQRSGRQKAEKQKQRVLSAQPRGLKPKGFSPRSGLRPFCGEFHIFRARFVKCGSDGEGNKTFLVRDVFHRDTGTRVADHVWLVELAELSKRHLKDNALLELEARPHDYLKGCRNDPRNPIRRDWTLGRVRFARIVRAVAPPALN